MAKKTDADTETKQAVALRDFADAGTEERFAKGDKLQLEPGAFANYAAAGLVRAADEPEPTPAPDQLPA